MYTRHAKVRCQQRGVMPEVVDTILTFGRRIRRHHAEVCFLDRRGRQQIEAERGHDSYRRMADKLDTYIVVADDGTIITASKRLRRIRV
jgi:hypothetical protein